MGLLKKMGLLKMGLILSGICAHRKKTSLWGVQPGQIQTRLYCNKILLNLDSCRRENHLISENKGDKQLWDCRAADQHLCFHVIKSMFSHDAAHID